MEPISIHSARVGGDGHVFLRPHSAIPFQSTPPVWAETRFDLHSDLHKFISIHSARVGGDKIEAVKRDKGRWISIHSARVGGDASRRSALWQLKDFNPLRPCGRRPITHDHPRSCLVFQSTPPVWAETSFLTQFAQSRTDFNPLRPCGRRRAKHGTYIPSEEFQSTPPVWAETFSLGIGRELYTFQSTPPVWAETVANFPLIYA